MGSLDLRIFSPKIIIIIFPIDFIFPIIITHDH